MAINPMSAPIDYLGQMGLSPQDPAQALVEGLKIGEVFRQQRQMREQEQLAEQYKADASAYYANPTPQGALELARKYPEQGAALMQDYRALGAEQKKNEFNRAARALSAVASGRTDIAKSIINDEIRAAAEAGGDASNLEMINAALDRDPDTAYASMMQILAVMDPEATSSIADALKKAGVGGAEEGYRALTAEEVAAKGLPPGNYQVALGGASKGKVSQIGGGGDDVNVTVENKQESKFLEQTGADLARQFETLSNMGLQASRASIKFNQLEEAFRSADVKTGAQGVLSTALSRFGIDVPGATEYQQIDALVASLIPLQRAPGSGSTSDSDMENFKRALPNLMGTKEGQLQIMQDLKAVAAHDIKVGEIANQARSGQITPFQALEMINQLPNPLEKYRNQQSAPPTVSGVVGMPAGPQGAGSGGPVDPKNPLLQ
jgi:hypothetical protein